MFLFMNPPDKIEWDSVRGSILGSVCTYLQRTKVEHVAPIEQDWQIPHI